MSIESAVDSLPLDAGWKLMRSEPGAAKSPEDICWGEAIVEAAVPGTVAASLARCGNNNCYPNSNQDDHDWWYQCEFKANRDDFQSIELQFDGLATIAEVWLNGESIHSSCNMFRRFSLDVTSHIKSTNTLCIVFRSLTNALKTKQARGVVASLATKAHHKAENRSACIRIILAYYCQTELRVFCLRH